MKLSALFARYLYQHKQLRLPGIGVFSIDPSVAVPDATEKTYPDFVQQIKYEQTPVNQPDEELVNFIRTETGKIKPLAESDLDSFLSDGKIMLNIGKPFHIEGIGSLMKTKSGSLDFTPGAPVLPKLEGFYNEPHTDDGARKRTPHADDYAQSTGSRKWAIATALIGGLALIIWGGYSLYNKQTAPAVSTAVVATDTPSAAAPATRANMILDSVKRIIDSSAARIRKAPDSAAPGTYRFVIERTASKDRALKRFQQLTDSRTGIKMETADSSLFSLYFALPATPADTARIRDSLRTWYARRQVFVEAN